MNCAWCQANPVRPGQRYCQRKCRQSAFRLRQRVVAAGATPASSTPRGHGPGTPPGVFVYADPPYVGLSSKYYRHEVTYRGEVDHHALIERLEAGRTDEGHLGWALSASSASLRFLLPLCPPGARVCAWVKPIGVPRATLGPHATWEPVIVVGGRKCRPGVRDWLRAQPARGGGNLPGRKPMAFCAWLFDLLGMVPGDRLIDVFPGTGGVGRAWANLSLAAAAKVSPVAGERLLFGAA